MTHPFDFAVWGTGVALVTIQSITRQLLEAERADGSCGPKREILENSSRPNLFICLPWLDGCGILCLLLAFFFLFCEAIFSWQFEAGQNDVVFCFVFKVVIEVRSTHLSFDQTNTSSFYSWEFLLFDGKRILLTTSVLIVNIPTIKKTGTSIWYMRKTGDISSADFRKFHDSWMTCIVKKVPGTNEALMCLKDASLIHCDLKPEMLGII